MSIVKSSLMCFWAGWGCWLFVFVDVPVWSKLESGHLPSMQQLVQILDNEMKLNVHMDSIPHHRS